MREELTQYALNIACLTFGEFKVDTSSQSTPLVRGGQRQLKADQNLLPGEYHLEFKTGFGGSNPHERNVLEQVTKEKEAALSGIRAMNQKEKVAREKARTAKTEERRGRRLTRPSRVRRQPPCCPSSSTRRALSSPT